MEGNVDTDHTVSQSLTVNNCGAESVLLDQSFENVPPSVGAADTLTTISTLESAPGTIDGPCSSMVTGDTGLLPASCVVEDDEPLPSHRRHHHYHHRRHRGSCRRHHRFCRVKWKEVNFMAAMLNIVAAVLVCTSLAEPRWWYIGGSPCMNYDHSASYLGVKQFFYKGFFVDRSTSTAEQNNKYYYGSFQDEGRCNFLKLVSYCKWWYFNVMFLFTH